MLTIRAATLIIRHCQTPKMRTHRWFEAINFRKPKRLMARINTHRLITRFPNSHTFDDARIPCHPGHTFCRNSPSFGKMCLTQKNRQLCSVIKPMFSDSLSVTSIRLRCGRVTSAVSWRNGLRPGLRTFVHSQQELFRQIYVFPRILVSGEFNDHRTLFHDWRA
jgi:hypothetical protein